LNDTTRYLRRENLAWGSEWNRFEFVILLNRGEGELAARDVMFPLAGEPGVLFGHSTPPRGGRVVSR
jgi:hypothetical protein